MIPVKVSKITFHHTSRSYAVLLDEISGERSLPVMVGACEAHSIALALEYTEPPRPMTHDLIKAMITESKGKINSVKITDLIDGVFYARIEIQGTQVGALNLDSRPSDAIAIALRTEAPIFVDESIMDEASQLEEENNKIGGEFFEIEEKKEDLEHKLRKAVELEKYEEAAVIRDQLKKYN
jgi:hypothetical protein